MLIYDVRNLSVPEQRRESSLMNQTRVIRGFPDTTGYALGSIEGRVAVEYFNPDPNVQKNKYAFKVRDEEEADVCGSVHGRADDGEASACRCLPF